MFIDGITKSLGGSNIRSCHLLADEAVIKFISVVPRGHSSFYSLAVAMAAYEMGLPRPREASSSRPTPVAALKKLLAESGLQHILGKGYYAFMNGPVRQSQGLE